MGRIGLRPQRGDVPLRDQSIQPFYGDNHYGNNTCWKYWGLS
jgi:hypothetical protein